MATIPQDVLDAIQLAVDLDTDADAADAEHATAVRAVVDAQANEEATASTAAEKQRAARDALREAVVKLRTTLGIPE